MQANKTNSVDAYLLKWLKPAIR